MFKIGVRHSIIQPLGQIAAASGRKRFDLENPTQKGGERYEES